MIGTISFHYSWRFYDHESGIDNYRLTIFEKYGGQVRRFKPSHLTQRFETIKPASFNDTSIYLNKSVTLKNGARYHVKVASLNRAKLSKSYDSLGVVMDATGPQLQEVSEIQ